MRFLFYYIITNKSRDKMSYIDTVKRVKFAHSQDMGAFDATTFARSQTDRVSVKRVNGEDAAERASKFARTPNALENAKIGTAERRLVDRIKTNVANVNMNDVYKFARDSAEFREDLYRAVHHLPTNRYAARIRYMAVYFGEKAAFEKARGVLVAERPTEDRPTKRFQFGEEDADEALLHRVSESDESALHDLEVRVKEGEAFREKLYEIASASRSNRYHNYARHVATEMGEYRKWSKALAANATLDDLDDAFDDMKMAD